MSEKSPCRTLADVKPYKSSNSDPLWSPSGDRWYHATESADRSSLQRYSLLTGSAASHGILQLAYRPPNRVRREGTDCPWTSVGSPLERSGLFFRPGKRTPGAVVDPRWTTRREAHSEISTHSSTPKRPGLGTAQASGQKTAGWLPQRRSERHRGSEPVLPRCRQGGLCAVSETDFAPSRTGSTATADHQADPSSLSTVAYESVSDTRLASFSKVALRKVSVIAVSCRRRFYGGADSQQGSDST